MPFTPIHLGPGAAFKAVGGRHFSFMVFGGSQVLIDIEPLIGILRGWDVLHGYTHTLAGALVIGFIAGVSGRPVSEFALRLLAIGHHPITWAVSLASGFVGTFSHLLFDGVMHADMQPFWPLWPGNPLPGALSIGWLHLLCLGMGVLGVAIMACMKLLGMGSMRR